MKIVKIEKLTFFYDETKDYCQYNETYFIHVKLTYSVRYFTYWIYL